MDSLTFHDIKFEKAKAISKYRRLQKLKTLFRLVELFVFVIVVSKLFPSQYALPLKVTGECFRRIIVTLISPRFVFLLGNAIVMVLFLKSGRFSAKNCDKITDKFYEEYAERSRRINSSQQNLLCGKSEKNITRSQSEKIEGERRNGEERRRDLRRSVTETRRKSPDGRRKLGTAVAEDEMSSEEFRRTVEEFIARQQRFLREEW